MRPSVLSLLLILGSRAAADRLIDIPTAKKLPFEDFRIEYDSEISSGRTQLAYLDMGIGTAFELTLHTDRIDDAAAVGTADLTYNYISPIADLTPGFAAGVMDVANTTQDGRRAFACVTFRSLLQGIDGNVSSDFTFGAYYRKGAVFYSGLSLPFSKAVRVIAEDDGFRVAAGLEVKPTPNLALQFVARGRNTLMNFAWTGHF